MLRRAHAEAHLLPTSLRPHLAPPTPLAPGTWVGRARCVGPAQGRALSLAPEGLRPKGGGLGTGSGRHTKVGQGS